MVCAKDGCKRPNGTHEFCPSHRPHDDCPVCLHPMYRGIETLGCNHKFHAGCIAFWLIRSLNCPVCRTPVATPTDDWRDPIIDEIYRATEEVDPVGTIRFEVTIRFDEPVPTPPQPLHPERIPDRNT